MVEVIIKGYYKDEFNSRRTYEICKINAGVTLKNNGGIFLTINDMKFQKKLEKMLNVKRDGS